MVKRYVLIFTVVCMAAFVGGCSKPPATVDGKGISKEKIDLFMKDRLQEHKLQKASVDEKKMKSAILQELIDEQLALNEAAAKNINIADADVDKEIDKTRKKLGEEQYQKALKDKGMTHEMYRNTLKDKMTLSRFIESLAKAEDLTEEQMRDFYKNSAKPFLRPAQVNMKIVEFQTEEAANAAAAEIQKTKADFDNYAKRLDTEKRASVTDYGWVSPDFFSPAMASSIKTLKDGQTGGPYKGRTGFYLVRVKERRSEGVSAFEEVKDSIRATMLQQKRNDAYMKWVEQKRKTSKIVINMK